MRSKRPILLFILLSLSFFIANAQAYWVWSPEKIEPTSSASKEPPQVTTVQAIHVDQPSVTIQESKSVPQPQPAEPILVKQTPPPAPVAVSKVVSKQKEEPKRREESKKDEAASVPPTSSYWLWSPTEGKFVQSGADTPQQNPEERFKLASKLLESGQEEDAIKELRNVVREFPGSLFASEAQFKIASALEKSDKLIPAVQEYKKLIKDFPRSERVDEAMERLYRVGNIFLTGEKQKVMGVAIIPVSSKAVEVFQFMIDQAP